MQMGLPMPRLWLIPEASPNAFATGRNPAHASVAVTAGLLELMNDRELEGVLAHELGHVTNRDILISSIAATIAAAITMLARMAFFFGGRRDEEDRGGGAFGGLFMLILAPIAAMVIQMAISRTREYSADAVGGPLYRRPPRAGQRPSETGALLPADSHGRLAGHRSHVHHQALQRPEPDAPVLDPSLDRAEDRAAHASGVTHRPVSTVRVNRKAESRVASGHPWIFSSDVIDRGGASAGDAVTVATPDGRPSGTAHFSSTSQISLRLLSSRVEAIGRGFLKRRLEAAAEFRRRVVSESDAYRLVHGEADGLPGLVVDRYGDYLVCRRWIRAWTGPRPNWCPVSRN